ncbi:MAG: hypothetical protein IT376_09720 [Polyangiaceae bacterium]|nr:hypothetical protein [Polyangiaceae bacterium]
MTAPHNDLPSAAPPRDVPVDWEALEDAFENNAPEVHSYLHLVTGEVLRVVDGIADPDMHTRIASDPAYLRVDPVSSREQYRWMERFIPVVEDTALRERLVRAIDGKGAFRRFKDALMAHAPERERWFAFRSERLRVFMEAWMSAHALVAVPRPRVWTEPPPAKSEAIPPSQELPAARRARVLEALRRQVREIAESLGARDLEKVVAFAEFVRARRAARGERGGVLPEALEPAAQEEPPAVAEPSGEEPPSSQERRAAP